MIRNILRDVKLKDIKLGKFCCLDLFLILGLCGCASKLILGDGFSVMGELRNVHGKQLNVCTIELQSQDGKIISGPDNIPGKFHKVFIVALREADYLISISCPGFKTYEITATYGEDVTHIRPLRIGKITMESLSLQF